jgi:putative molybdenum carrier protein
VPQLVVRSGGQTGVDRAAIDVAIAQGIPYCGWCPRGGWAEDLVEPPGLLATYSNLVPTPSNEPAQRTAWNVRDGDATLIVLPAGGQGRFDKFPGTKSTRVFAELIFQRPYLVAELTVEHTPRAVARWITERMQGAQSERFELHIGGPRESEHHGLYAATTEFLTKLLRQVPQLQSA